jgi:hypothetical protein
MLRIGRRPSPALVLACLALAIALSGTGIAASTQVPNNSVGTSQLKNDAVTSPKIKSGAVQSSEIKDGASLRTIFTTTRSQTRRSARTR